MTRLSSALFLGFAFLAGPASAHPDHTGDSAASFVHLLQDPFHLSMIAVAAGVALAARAWLRRAAR